MRVLLSQSMLYVPAHGGANKANRALLEALAQAGHECAAVALAIGRHGPRDREEFAAALATRGIEATRSGRDCVEFTLGGVSVSAAGSVAGLPPLFKATVRRLRPDVLLVSSEDPGQRLLAAALEAASVPVVLLAQTTSTLPFGPHSFFPSVAGSRLARRAAMVITPSRYLADYAERHGGVRATVLTPPVFHPGDYPWCGRFDGEFVTMVNPCSYKGLAIFTQLARQRPDVAFAAVPSWGTTSHDRQLLESLGNVTLLPEHDSIDTILSRTRVLVVPSLWAEAFGLVSIEAMLRGIPVLASDIGGLAEAKLGVDYLLPVRPIRRFSDQLDERGCPVAEVPEPDVAPWLGSLAKVLADQETYRRLSTASRRAAESFVAGARPAAFVEQLETVPPAAERAASSRAATGEPAATPVDRLAALSPAKRRLVELRLRQRRQATRATSGSGIPRRTDNGPAPLSFGQERLWLLHQLEPDNPFYNEHVTVRLRGRLDLDALRASLTEIGRRHEVLRTRIEQRDGSPIQIVEPEVAVRLALASVDHLAAEVREAEARRLARSEACKPFDLTRAPLVRVLLVRLGHDDHLLLLASHYIVGDHWAISVLCHELSALYPCHAQGRPSPLPPLAIQYADFAVWQRTRLERGDLDHQLDYWRSQLDGLPAALALPTDRSRPATPAHRGGAVTVELPATLTHAVDTFARLRHTTPYSVLLTGFAALLHRYTGQDDLAIGSPVAGRNRTETEPLLGFFLNMLVLRSRLDRGSAAFADLSDAMSRTVRQALANQDLPFERLVDALGPDRQPGRIPLFQVAFTFQDIPMRGLELPGMRAELEWFEIGVSKLDLDLYIERTGDRLRAVLIYDSELFEQRTAERMLGHYRRLLEAMVADPEQSVADADLLTPAERSTILESWNATAAPFPGGHRLHELFEERVDKEPDTPAVQSAHGSLSYGELEVRANRLAHLLRERGAGPGRLVAICLERTPDLVTALLATVKVGAAYLPLDPDHPPDRLRHLLADAGPCLLVTRSGLVPGPLPAALPAVCLDTDRTSVASQSSERLVSAGGPTDLACVIYTSGSTGQPKGVLLDHRGRVNNFTDFNRRFQVGPGDALLAVSSPAFDMFGYDAFGTLTAGASVVLPTPGFEAYPEHLVELMRQQRVTVWHSVPMLFSMVLDHLATQDDPGPGGWALRVALLGGDWIPVNLPDRARAQFPELRVVSLGGATEVSMDSTIYEVGEVDPEWTSIPYGGPMANQQAYVLDPRGNPAPIGVPGELYLGGAGLAWGYHRRADLTATRFVPNPFRRNGRERIYRTGDRARWRAAGTLELLGRIDYQLNVGGHRIEPGEVEAAIASHPAVDRAIVSAQGPRHRQQLVAWFVPAGEPPATRALREHVAARLPDYMVPARFLALAALPLTPNGKVDRAQLPEVPGAASPREHADPRTDTERTLAGIYAEVLGLERRPSVHDGFFQLGGDSILAIQVVTRARQAGFAFSPKQLFVHQTVAELAGAASVRSASPEGPTPATGHLPGDSVAAARRRYPQALAIAAVGPTQKTMLARQREQTVPGIYTMAGTVGLPAVIDAPTLTSAWRRLVARHEILRTAFVPTGSGPVQVVLDQAPVEIAQDDWRGLEPAEQQEKLRRLLAEYRTRGFDPTHPPLFALHLIRLDRDTSLLLRLNHYLIADGWSLSVLFRELMTIYSTLSLGNEPDLADHQPRPYRDFVAWVEAQDAGAASTFWGQQLAGAPACSAVESLGGNPTLAPSGFGQASVALETEHSTRLRAAARTSGLTVATLVQGAWASMLARRSGLDEVIFGVTSSGRPPELDGVEDIVGLLINTVPVRARVGTAGPNPGWLGELQRRRADAAAFEHLPLDRIAEAAGLAARPLIDSLLVFDNYPVSEQIRELSRGSALSHPLTKPDIVTSPTEFPLRVDVATDDTIALHATFHVPVLDHAAVASALHEVTAILAAVGSNQPGTDGPAP